MKTLSILCAILLVAGCMPASEAPQYDVTGVVLIDVTDNHSLKPTAAAIIEALRLRGIRLYAGVQITVSTISDMHINKEITVCLPKENSLYSNKYARQSKIEAFKTQLDSAIQVCLPIDPVPLKRSVALYTLQKSLIALQKISVPEKLIFIYSDLAEHSHASLNFYNADVLQKIQENPSQFRHRIDSMYPLPDHLTGITAYLKFRPNSPEEDARYKLISTLLFIPWLEAKNVHVIQEAQ